MAVGWRARIAGLLTGRARAPAEVDPDAVVEATSVSLATSAMTVAVLADQGIRASVIDETRVYGLGGIMVPMVRVFVAARDLERANEIIAELSS